MVDPSSLLVLSTLLKGNSSPVQKVIESIFLFKSIIDFNVNNLFTRLIKWVKSYWYKYRKIITYSYTIGIGLKGKEETNANTALQAIYDFIIKNCNVKDIIQCDKRRSGYFFDSINDNTNIIIPIMKNTLKLKDDIYCYSTETDLDLAESTNYIELKHVKLHIYSDTLSQQNISSFLKNIIDIYEDKKNKEAFGTSLKILSWNNLSTSEESDEDDCDYQIFDNESAITFNNLILPYQTDLTIKQRLQYFNENKAVYVSKGKPYTFGLCLFGPPGTGKTSFIKALANETKRHICMISFDESMTLPDLQKIFYSNIKNGKKISPKDLIFVIPEADGHDIFLKREYQSSTEESTIVTELSSKRDDFSKNKKKGITLQDWLNIFNGLVEVTGAIFVMTTNHVDKLDPALIRPGRMDLVIELTKCKTKEVERMITYLFDLDNPVSLDVNIDDKYSPAEVNELCCQYSSNLEGLLSFLNST